MPRRPFRVFDSELGLEYPDHWLWSAAYEPIWQSMRVGFIGKWNTMQGMREVCALLQVYINHGVVGNDKQIRIWRAYNLLNAIPYHAMSANGIHGFSSDVVDYMLAYRETVRALYYHTPFATEWDWAITRAGLKILWKTNPGAMTLQYRKLQRRPTRSVPKLELDHYLAMNLEVMAEIFVPADEEGDDNEGG